MYDLSVPRVTRFTLILGAAGSIAALIGWDYRAAVGFLAGAALSLVSIRSWVRVAESLNPEGPAPRSGAASAVFLALRYVLIAGAVYATMKVLGSAPAAILLGLLVSFAAVVLDLLFGTVLSKN